MDSVGTRLHDARLQLGISLEQIRAKTCIATRVLHAIENDDLSQIDGPFFYKSFVRQFAEAVQLQFGDLAELIQSAVTAMPQPLMPGEGRTALPKIAPLQVKGPGSGRWLSSVASLIVMLVACSTLYAMWQNSKSNLNAAAGDFVKSFTQNPPGERSPEQNVTPLASRPVPSAVIAPVNEPAFHVELSAMEATWLSIVADGKKTFSGILGPAETKVLDGYSVARVRTGNAGGINMVFNGKPVGTLGPRGQVRIAIFSRNGYEIVEPPTHIAWALFNVNAE